MPTTKLSRVGRSEYPIGTFKISCTGGVQGPTSVCEWTQKRVLHYAVYVSSQGVSVSICGRGPDRDELRDKESYRLTVRAISEGGLASNRSHITSPSKGCLVMAQASGKDHKSRAISGPRFRIPCGDSTERAYKAPPRGHFREFTWSIPHRLIYLPRHPESTCIPQLCRHFPKLGLEYSMLRGTVGYSVVRQANC